jgi:K+-transporting ATPase ATPase C chain
VIEKKGGPTMARNISKSLILLTLTVVICCVIYPLAVWAIGQALFPFQAGGSMITDSTGAVVGSRLIAQPFTKDEYFQPRPSAASYDASASASSALAPSNYALRDRVGRMLGPIAKYRGGKKAGQPVAPDIEAWFQKDRFQGEPHIVAQWADAHNSLAQAWAKADPMNGELIKKWAADHGEEVSQWIKSNPATSEPKPEDLAVIFFEDWSKTSAGTWPSAVEHTTKDGKTEKAIERVKEGSDIQSIFFDMWRQDHPNAALEDVPGDLVTASASGLDPDITLKNALYQLDRVASQWAKDTNRDPEDVKNEIQAVLEEKAWAPLGGLAGVKMVNVLEVNLELTKRYGTLGTASVPASTAHEAAAEQAHTAAADSVETKKPPVKHHKHRKPVPAPVAPSNG